MTLSIIFDAEEWLKEQGLNPNDIEAVEFGDKSISNDIQIQRTPTPPPPPPPSKLPHLVWEETMDGDERFDRFTERLQVPEIADFDSLEWDIVATEEMQTVDAMEADDAVFVSLKERIE